MKGACLRKVGYVGCGSTTAEINFKKVLLDNGYFIWNNEILEIIEEKKKND